MTEQQSLEKVQCAECQRLTNHDVLAVHRSSGETPDGDIRWWETHQIVQCRGCETVSFRKATTTSEDFDPYTGEPYISENLYPNRTEGREPMIGYEQFPARTRHMYLEVLKALNSSAPILTAIGLRALIESICLEQKTKAKNLAGNIDELADLGYLSEKQAEFLHAHRFMGNDAAHEIRAPQPQDLIAALDVAETLLKTIYILPDVAASITTKRPGPQPTAPATP
ncbi:MAG: DUF4145 domain-containing protein [Gemmatimonadetes bacterium]|nr:DUF4145 domain-containing protein [Gemmatimonadota bacterium]